MPSVEPPRRFARLRGLFAAPESPRTPMAPSYAQPLSFGLTLPDEMLRGMGLTGDLEAKVSRTEAMSVPAVKRVRDLICATQGLLPLKLYNSGRVEQDWELGSQPEEDVAESVTWTRVSEDLLFEGISWLRITEYDANGFPAHVVRLLPGTVNVQQDGRIWVNSQSGLPQGMSNTYTADSELIRIDSPNDGLLKAAARAIRICLLIMKATGGYVKNPNPLGVLTPKSEEFELGSIAAINEMLDHWEDQRAKRAWGYVGAGLEAKPLTWNPEQMQLNRLWDNAVVEIGRAAGVDPEELGVSTTSRTYANAEQRRLDLIDFTIMPYLRAVEARCRMNDVTPPGYYAAYDFAGFLRSDTETRFRVYAQGRELGLYSDERLAKLENIPKLTPPKPPAPPPAPKPAPEPAQQPGEGAKDVEAHRHTRGAQFSADAPSEPMRFVFDGELPDDLKFTADEEKRVIAGLSLPWDHVAYSGGYLWSFAPGSLHWSATSRVKLDKDHWDGSEFGVATELINHSSGLVSKFKVARGQAGDDALASAADGVFDGLSVYVTFEGAADGWTEHPDNPAVRYVHSATLRKVALTAQPAFDDARVTSVAANRDWRSKVDTDKDKAPTNADTVVAAAAPFDGEKFSAAIAKGVAEALAPVLEKLNQPNSRAEVKAGRATVEYEPPVYAFNGTGHSLVRDTWKARTEGDHEALGRVRKFSEQTADVAKQMAQDPAKFAATTGNASALVPPGYRPDLMVTQILKGRPLIDSVSRGTLTDSTPFNIPVYVSDSNLTSEHVEGVNPGEGNIVLTTKTVSPTAVSGLFKLTREIADSANPAIDAIAANAMREDYRRRTEALLYARLNGPDGVGGAITAGFVPSGARVYTTNGQGEELLDGVREAMANFMFDRFAPMDEVKISQEATVEFAKAKDSAGRPMLPQVGPNNAVGTAGRAISGFLLDGLTAEPTWSLTGNTVDDTDVLMFNSEDVWFWESGLLMFRYEERNGPAFIDLALFGYVGSAILQPKGLASVRHTHAAP